MRPTEQLIQELDREAGNFRRCALFMGAEDGSTILIWADDSDRGRTLDEAIKAGGEPVGLIGYRMSGDPGPPSGARTELHQWHFTTTVRRLEEHAGEDWAADYLLKLADKFRQSIDGGLIS